MDVASWAIVLPLIEYHIHGLNYMETTKGVVAVWIGHNCLVALSLSHWWKRGTFEFHFCHNLCCSPVLQLCIGIAPYCRGSCGRLPSGFATHYSCQYIQVASWGSDWASSTKGRCQRTWVWWHADAEKASTARVDYGSQAEECSSFYCRSYSSPMHHPARV